MEMNQEIREKFEELAKELKDVMTNPDIDIEICFKDVEEGESCRVDAPYPYIKVKYITEEHDVHEKDIEIAPDHWSKDVSELKEYVTFMIEQFMEEIDSVEYGGE